ncbi:hypothetical protein CSUI_003852, partial [Cystoisospora suis]
MLVFYFLSDDERRKGRRKREDDAEDDENRREEHRNEKRFYFSNIRKLLRKASTRGPRIAVYRHLFNSPCAKEETSHEDEEEEKELVSVVCKPSLSVQDFVAFFLIMQGDLHTPFLPPSSSSFLGSPSLHRISLSSSSLRPRSAFSLLRMKGKKEERKEEVDHLKEEGGRVSSPTCAITSEDLDCLVGGYVGQLLEKLDIVDVLPHVKLRELLHYLSPPYR